MFASVRSGAMGLAIIVLGCLLRGVDTVYAETDYRIHGGNRVDVDAIVRYKLRDSGHTDVDDVIQEIYATGFFDEVHTSVADDGSVDIYVVENPLVEDIKYEGNKKLSAKELGIAVSIKPYSVLNKHKLAESVDRMVAVYRASGYNGVIVEAFKRPRVGGRSIIVMHVDEGRQTRVDKVSFGRVSSMTFRDLRKQLATKVGSRTILSLFSDNVYNSETLIRDEENLSRYYGDSGFPKFNVLGVGVLYSNHHGLELVYNLYEGKRYVFGDPTVAVDDASSSDEDLMRCVSIKPGGQFSVYDINKSEENLAAAMRKSGYPFPEVRVEYGFDDTALTVSPRFFVGNLHGYRIRNINIRGNNITDEDVIRRELSINEGDTYNVPSIQNSYLNLVNSSYFENQLISSEIVGSGLIDLNIAVKERPTGDMGIGFSYGTGLGIGGYITYSSGNWMGRGQKAAFGLQAVPSGVTKYISFTEPFVCNIPLSLSGHLHSSDKREDYYNSKTRGGGFGATLRDIASNGAYSANYSVDVSTISDINAHTPPPLLQGVIDRALGTVSFGYVQDRRDNVAYPTSGHCVSLKLEIGGGPVASELPNPRMRKLHSEVQFYNLLDDKHQTVLSIKAALGAIVSTDDIGILDRYRRIVESMRGIEAGAMGPYDIEYGVYLGSNYLKAFTVQVDRKLPAEEVDLRAFAFMDFGVLSGVDAPDMRKVNDGAVPRVSVGIGLLWLSRWSPIRIYYARPINKSPTDVVQHFGFNFGA